MDRRLWNPDEWQVFAIKLIQLRHGAHNVQLVPDKVRGDAGLECFTTDGCLYQCYAPEEVSDVKKAASAMKAKAVRDLKKLIAFEDKIAALLQSIAAKRWILLCPFLDDKEVIIHVRQKGAEIKTSGLGFIDSGFEALVQQQADFQSEIQQLRLKSLGPPIQLQEPSPELVVERADSTFGVRLTEKLSRAFPDATMTEIEARKNECIRAHLVRENALETMRVDHPVLWDRSNRCLQAEESRLVATGGGFGAPTQSLSDSITRIEESLGKDLPSLERSVITQVAVGTISDWLLRCPLDFPKS